MSVFIFIFSASCCKIEARTLSKISGLIKQLYINIFIDDNRMSGSDSEEENLTISKLVDDSLNFLNSSKFAINPKSFSKINDKLLSYDNSSSASNTILKSNKEILSIKSGSRKGNLFILVQIINFLFIYYNRKDANPILQAQIKSSLYDPNVMTTKDVKIEEKKKNLGRGWFDIEVRQLLLFHSIMLSKANEARRQG